MKIYKEPKFEVIAISANDILTKSETILDSGALFGEESGVVMVSEYTGEVFEG